MNDSELIKDQLTYNPQIDGLRAIAVLVVLFFHFDLFGVKGGFVGVDVFFVISGFLISSIVLRQIEANKFSLAEFYARRARRILPALSVMLGTVSVVGWFLLLPLAYAEFGKSLIAVSLGAANVFYWRTLNYFGASGEETPLLHCWSLAVEEQFYFLLPVAMVAIHVVCRRFAKSYHQSLLLFLLVSWGISLGASQFLLSLGKQQAVFFLLPTRAWELLTGTLLSLVPVAWIPQRRSLRSLLLIAGLTCILAACFVFDAGTTFPGIAALLPCLGAALVIFASSNFSLETSAVGQMLSCTPLRACGLISYSLYLWHWPIWVFLNYYQFDEPSFGFRLLAMGLSLVAGYVSWRFIEQPFRNGRERSSVRVSLKAAAVSLMGGTLTGLLLCQQEGLPQRFPDELSHMLQVSDPWSGQVRLELTIDDVKKGRLVPLSERSGDPPDILLWGDSHAIAAIPAIEKLCREDGVSAVAATHSATLPVLDMVQLPHKAGLGKDAPEFAREVVDYVNRSNVKHVVMIAAWYGTVQEMTQPMLATTKAIQEAGAKPWIVIQVPSHPVAIPKALARMVVWKESDGRYRARDTPHPLFGQRMHGNGLVKQLEDAGATIIDVRSSFWDDKSQSYMIALDGRALYHDTNHMTPYAAENLLEPLIREAMLPDIIQAKMPVDSND